MRKRGGTSEYATALHESAAATVWVCSTPPHLRMDGHIFLSDYTTAALATDRQCNRTLVMSNYAAVKAAVVSEYRQDRDGRDRRSIARHRNGPRHRRYGRLTRRSSGRRDRVKAGPADQKLALWGRTWWPLLGATPIEKAKK